MASSNSPIEIIERLFSKRRQFERFAMLYIHNAHLVQDIVSESYAYIWEHRDSIDLDDNVEAYMFNVVKHRCLDHLSHELVRRNAEERMLDDARWQLEMDIATLKAFDPLWLYDSDVRACIKQALDSLPSKTRRIFLLSRIEHKTYREIAEIEGLSVKSVEFHVSKALKTLRADLGDYYIVLLLLLADTGSSVMAG